MFIQETKRIIDAFLDRYLRLGLEGGPDAEYTNMHAFVDPADQLIKVDFTLGEHGKTQYTLRAWFDNMPDEEFHVICTDTATSCIDFAQEHDLSEDDINYLRFGRHINM